MKLLILTLISLIHLSSGASNATEALPGDVNQNIYINVINQFPETDEFYITLNFNHEISDSEFYLLKSMADSTLYYDEEHYEWSRKLLPIHIAENYFDLHSFRELNVYNHEHQFITSISFKRVEYYEAATDGGFIAVFRPADVQTVNVNSEYLYAVSSSANYMADFSSKRTSIDLLDELSEFMHEKPDHVWSSNSFVIKPLNQVYSVYSIYKQGDGSTSYLVKKSNEDFSVLLQIKERIAFFDLLPTRMIYNDKPVFILKTGLPESDFIDHKIAYSANGEYKILDGYVLSD